MTKIKALLDDLNFAVELNSRSRLLVVDSRYPTLIYIIIAVWFFSDIFRW